jgi:hypothetical protein
MKRDPLREDNRNSISFVRLLHLSGWTQARAGQELGLTTGAISQFVGGISRPKDSVIRLFTLIMGERAAHEEAIKNSPGHERPVIPLEEWELEMIQELRKLDTKSRREALEGMKMIASATSHTSD